MKITSGDLDAALRNKISRFDDIVVKYTEGDVNSYIAYNGSSFYLKKINEINQNKIISEKEINDYNNQISNGTDYLMKDINFENICASNAMFQVISMNHNTKIDFKSDIIKIKYYDTYAIVLDKDGNISKINLNINTNIETFNILAEIKKNFSITNLYPYDLLDFEPYDKGLLISTRQAGVFYYDYEKLSVETKFSLNNVSIIKDMGDKHILCAADKNNFNVCIYDFDSGDKIESYNELKKAGNQQPYKLAYVDKTCYILGKTYGLNQSGKLLHSFKMHDDSNEIDNIDGIIAPVPEDNRYQVLNMVIDNNSLYILGIFKNHIFIWQYQLDSMFSSPTETILEQYTIDTIDILTIKNGLLYFNIKDHLLALDNTGKIINNLLLERISKNLLLTKNGFYVTSENSVFYYTYPIYSFKDIITFDIYHSDKPCNNIDIFIKLKNNKEELEFFDDDTKKIITPAYYIIDNTWAYLKLLGITSSNIKMTLKTTKDSGNEVYGIIIYPNKIYLN